MNLIKKVLVTNVEGLPAGMPVDKEAQKAITSLQGYSLSGKVITVIEVPGADEEHYTDSIFFK